MQRLFPLLGLTVLSACGPGDRNASATRIDDSLFQEGELIFRQGDSMESIAIRATQGGGWSHVGIVVRRPNGDLVVLHAMPPTSANTTKGVDQVPIDTFLRETDAFGLYRPISAEAGRSAAIEAQHYEGRPFDAELDADTDQAIYCTELIVRAFARTEQPINPVRRQLNIPFLGHRPLILPQDLADAKGLARIF